MLVGATPVPVFQVLVEGARECSRLRCSGNRWQRGLRDSARTVGGGTSRATRFSPASTDCAGAGPHSSQTTLAATGSGGRWRCRCACRRSAYSLNAGAYARHCRYGGALSPARGHPLQRKERYRFAERLFDPLMRLSGSFAPWPVGLMVGEDVAQLMRELIGELIPARIPHAQEDAIPCSWRTLAQYRRPSWLQATTRRFGVCSGKYGSSASTTEFSTVAISSTRAACQPPGATSIATGRVASPGAAAESGPGRQNEVIRQTCASKDRMSPLVSTK